MLAFRARNDGARDRSAIHSNLLHALLVSARILYCDMVFATTELAGYLILLSGAWETRIDEQTFIIWLDAEDEF